MSASNFVKNVDKGFYHDARIKGISPYAFIAQQVQPEEPEIRKRFEALLRRSKRQEDGSAFALALWDFATNQVALEKCFKETGLRVRGPYSDTVEKFYTSTSSDTALFPAFLGTNIIQGMLTSSIADRLVATDQRVSSHVIQKVTMAETEGDRELKQTSEGAVMPETSITTTEGSVRLYKFGRVLEWTYEVARLLQANIVAIFLQRMGRQFAIQMVNRMLDVLVSGDGTTGSAATVLASEGGTLTYNEIIRLSQQFDDGYEMTDLIGGATMTRNLLNLAEFKDPLVWMAPNGTPLRGGLPMRDGLLGPIQVFGADYWQWRSASAPTSFQADRLVAIDRNVALMSLQEGDFLEESDKIIDRGVNRQAMSVWKGWMKLDNEGVQVLDLSGS